MPLTSLVDRCRPVAFALKDEDPVLSLRNMRAVKSEAKLDRHIEPGNSLLWGVTRVCILLIVSGSVDQTAH